MAAIKAELEKCKGFQWDSGNIDKNWLKHKVSRLESEQVFFNRPLLVATDDDHSRREHLYFALGKTDLERELFVVFTVREDLIRVISARDISRKEREVYTNAKKEEDSEI
jgi:uncharacterized DUF497 family protein